MPKTLIAALAGMTSLASIAGAASLIEEQSVTYAGLDLSRPAGAKIMVARIERAAVAVCGGRADERGLWLQRVRKACIEETIERALADLDAPMVTAVYRNGAAVGEIASKE